MTLRRDRRAIVKLACPATELSPPCAGSLGDSGLTNRQKSFRMSDHWVEFEA